MSFKLLQKDADIKVLDFVESVTKENESLPQYIHESSFHSGFSGAKSFLTIQIRRKIQDKCLQIKITFQI